MIRAVATLASGEILARIAAFAATTLLARRLGPEGFGILGFAMAFCGYFALAANSAIQEIGARDVARNTVRARQLYASVTLVQLLVATAAFAVLAGVARLLPQAPPTPLVVLLCGLSFFSLAFDATWALRGLERPVMASSATMLGQGLYALAVVTLVHGPDDLTTVPVMQFAAEVLAGILFGGLLLRFRVPDIRLREGLEVLRGTGYLSIAKLLRTVVVTSDVVLLGFLATKHEVGLYTAAYRVAFLLMSIATAVGGVYLPSYSRTITRGHEPMRRLVETSLGTTGLVAAPLVGGVVVTAGPLLEFLFGPPYADAALALRLLALGIGVLFIYGFAINILIAGGRTGTIAKLRAGAAVLTLTLNFVVIPRWGMVGAAAATLFAEVTVLAMSLVVVHRMRLTPSWRPLAAPAMAAGIMSATLWFAAAGLPVLAQVALGAVIYVAVLAATGHLPSRGHLPEADL